MNKDQLERAVDLAYDRGYDAGKWDTADAIFKDLEKAMQRSKTTHVGWEFFGMILEDYVEDMKLKYGIKEPQHNPVVSGYYVEPKGESVGGVPVAPTDTWNISGYKVEED